MRLSRTNCNNPRSGVSAVYSEFVTMNNYLDRSHFLNRLSALQRLCSDHDDNFPNALLFVPGADGRNNKGSITVLKYLLRGAVSRDLFDETMEAEYECLEDIVLLVKATSLTVIWSHEMKRILLPLFDSVPFLIEYCSTPEEESEIDLLQARKCTDFKRMMLESVKQGGGVGIPVPIGYDDIQDIESWPMLQAFALDHVYCPTGFFTARYTVADITSHLEVLFRTVDGYYLENAIRSMVRSVGPHMVQAAGMLDASTAEQRMRVTADDVAGPLEILYDFGEMESAGTVDASTKPIVLFGADTSQFGAVAGAYPAAWRTQPAGRALHTIIEGCEPCSGLRWCRTYFLQRGRAAATVDISDDLLAAEDEDTDYTGGDSKTSASERYLAGGAGQVDARVARSLLRLEGLYAKLTLGLRHVVKYAFARHSDVLEAGTEVQTVLTAMMKGEDVSASGLDVFEQEQWRSLGLSNAAFVLKHGEQLQVHMDCMNALGEIVAIEDVDDMGGSCWTYIRVAVHGVEVPQHGAHPSTVAVGDTFLFSSHRSTLGTRLSTVLGTNGPASSLVTDRLLLQGDGCCITHPLPYYRCLIGAGAEEHSARRLLMCTKSTHLLPRLGLGKALDFTGTGAMTLTVLTDHPIVPHFEAELHAFSEGFVVEKMDGAMCLPMLVSIGQHVDRVWTVDPADCMAHASKLFSSVFLKDRNLPDVEVPQGILVVFRLKADGVQVDDLNPVQRTLPLVGASGASPAKHVAFVVPSDSRYASAMSAVCSQWHVAMRMHDVQDHRGGAEVALPEAVLRAYVAFLDYWREGVPSIMAATDTSASNGAGRSPDLAAESNRALFGTALAFAKHPALLIPGAGYYAMRCLHSVSDALRVSTFESGALQPATVKASGTNSVQLLVVAGHAGSGIGLVTSHLAQQFADSLSAASTVRHASVDFTAYDANTALSTFIDASINDAEVLHGGSDVPIGPTHAISSTVVVSVIVSAQHHLSLPLLVSMLEHRLQAASTTVLSVLAPAALDINALHHRYAMKPLSESGHGLGFEMWRAIAGRDLLQPSVCDGVILVEDPATGGEGRAADKRVRDFISSVLPAAVVIKLSPAGLRLDQESLEVVQTLMQASANTATPTERLASAAVRGQPVAGMVARLPEEVRAEHVKTWVLSPSECPAHVGCGVHSLCFTPHGLGISAWNATSVLQAVQALLPTARVHASAVETAWKVPPLRQGEHTPRLKRLAQLATAKVLCTRQEEEGRRLFHAALDRLRLVKANALSDTEEVLTRLIRGVRSVHGTLQTPGGVRASSAASNAGGHSTTPLGVASTTMALEANPSFVVQRSTTGDVFRRGVHLIVQGVFGPEEVGLLQQLFTACAQHVLPRRDLLTADQVGDVARLRIQDDPRYSSKLPLPGNWWYDGHVYVDINGTRRTLRPDIEKLVELYVEAENAKIAEYNALLEQL